MPNYRINHTQVGPWREGRVVTEEDIQKLDPDGEHDVFNRWLNRDAIVPTDDEVTEGPAPLNPQNMPMVTSGGHVVDAPGNDRPAAAALLSRSKIAQQQQAQLESQEESTVPYAEMDKSELAALARTRAIPNAGRMTKDQLVAALEDDDAAAASQPE